jgi:hypothetical protein
MYLYAERLELEMMRLGHVREVIAENDRREFLSESENEW